MEIDIRLPIGGMFLLLGALLLLFGLTTISDPQMYQRSLDININIWSGLLMLVFGGSMLFLGIRARRSKPK